MADDLLEKLQGLLSNPDIGAQLKQFMPDGSSFDVGKLLEGLKANPDLLAKIQALLPGVDIMGGLSGILGAAGHAAGAATGAAGDTAGAATDKAGDTAGAATGTAGGLLDKVKSLFGR